MPRNAEELVEVLALKECGPDRFEGALPRRTQLHRLYGGLMFAQSYLAAARTTDPSYEVHSLHTTVISPGAIDVPMTYEIRNVRDGRNFATRLVEGRQDDRLVLTGTFEFHRPEVGRGHQDAMPLDLPGPYETPKRQPADPANDEWGCMDFRRADGGAGEPEHGERPGWQRYWFRLNGDLGEDPVLQTAALIYASDMSLMGAALAPHGLRAGDARTMIATLNHSMWFHHSHPVHEWWLYDQHSPASAHGRGLSFASIFAADGTLTTSVAQEAVLRPNAV